MQNNLATGKYDEPQEEKVYTRQMNAYNPVNHLNLYEYPTYLEKEEIPPFNQDHCILISLC